MDLGTRKNSIIGRYWIYTLPFLFLILIVLFYPFRYVFEFDTDEGIQLIKGLLHARGYDLYSEIFNDQPPLFTLLLSSVFQISRYNVTISRLVVLAFSSLLLFSSLAYLSIFWGQLHAVFGFLMLLLIPFYNRLSVSVMIGLPAIALATASFLTLTLWHKHRNFSWLIISAVALALSITTKLFTAILIPIFILGILTAEYETARGNRSWMDSLKPFLIWISTFGFVLIFILLLFVGIENIDQLFETHLFARGEEGFASRARETNINSYLRGSWAILIAAILGTVVSIWKRRWNALYLIAWMFAGYVSLNLTTPVWYHHQLLVTVPAALLAGLFTGESIEYLKGYQDKKVGSLLRNITFIIGVLFVIIFVVTRAFALTRQLDPMLPNISGAIDAESQEYPLLALMSDHSSDNDLVVTDRPMFAFRLMKEIPPELAVISDKRFQSGSLDEELILNLIRNRKPEQILFGRYAFDQIEREIETEYQLIYIAGRYRLYVER